MLDLFRIVKSGERPGGTLQVKPGRYLRGSGDYKTECPFCGKECRARMRNGSPVLYQNCHPRHDSGHATTVLSRDKYGDEFGTEDRLYESNLPVFFVFRNVTMESNMMPEWLLETTLNKLNYVVPTGDGFYTMQATKTRHVRILHHLSTSGEALPVIKATSYREAVEMMEAKIKEIKASRNTGSASKVIPIGRKKSA